MGLRAVSLADEVLATQVKTTRTSFFDPKQIAAVEAQIRTEGRTGKLILNINQGRCLGVQWEENS